MEDDRVVGNGVDLYFYLFLYIADGVTARAVHLRQTAQRIGVLHAVFLIGFDYLAAFEQAAHIFGDGSLSHLRAQVVRPLVEGVGNGVKRFG